MNKAFLSLLFGLLLLPSLLLAQEKYTLSGYVRDAGSGESLIGAYVVATPPDLPEGKNPSYATTNEYGFYSMTLPAGTYTVLSSYVQSKSQPQQVVLNEDTRLNIELGTQVELQEVVVTGESKTENIQSTEMGKFELKPSDIESVPVLFGEADILKTLQLLPGVQSAGEGSAGFYVRGGGPDQNLVLLDEAVVYNTGHLFGFFSVFNSDAIKSTTLIKGGMPAQYGGRLSSVLDISMREGNMKEFHGKGGIGLISSKLTLEGPIVEDKASFMVSGRRTYIDAIVKPFIKNSTFGGSGYYFYDVNAKVNYRFSDKDRLYLSGYFGRDVFNFSSEDDALSINMPWGNATATARWNHLFSDKLFMNASAIYNDYNFEIGAGQDDFTFSLYSGIRDYSFETDFTYFPGSNHQMRFGGSYTYHTFIPSVVSGQAGDVEIEPEGVTRKYAHESAVYVQDEFDFLQRFRVNAGVRFSWFQQLGPYQFVDPQTLDSASYGKGEPVEDYWGVEPRLSLRYQINELSSLKGSVAYTNQYIHLVSNAGNTLPTDIWVPSTKRVEPQRGIQYAVGFFQNLFRNEWETSVEVYYKDLENQIEFNQYYVPELTQEIEQEFVFGDGRSYGMELFLKKRTGKLNGWIGYTLSKTERKFEDLNDGEWFPARYDRRHDLSVVAIYEPAERWTLSGTFVYGTGIAFTMPEALYFIDGQMLQDYGDINTMRMKPYHRMDLSVTRHGRPTAKFRSDWVFSIYNVYSRMNPYIIYLDSEGNLLEGTTDITAKQISLFPILPSITWMFEF